jgi:hypothetical protein
MRQKSKSAEGFADLATRLDAGSPLAAVHNDLSYDLRLTVLTAFASRLSVSGEDLASHNGM